MDIMYSPVKDDKFQNNVVRIGINVKKNIIKGVRYIKTSK